MYALLCVLSYALSYVCSPLWFHTYGFKKTPLLCVLSSALSYVCFRLCSHMCAVTCVFSDLCSYVLCAPKPNPICILSYVRFHMFNPLCPHPYVIIIIIASMSLVFLCTPLLFGISCRDNSSIFFIS